MEVECGVDNRRKISRFSNAMIRYFKVFNNKWTVEPRCVARNLYRPQITDFYYFTVLKQIMSSTLVALEKNICITTLKVLIIYEKTFKINYNYFIILLRIF